MDDGKTALATSQKATKKLLKSLGKHFPSLYKIDWQ